MSEKRFESYGALWSKLGGTSPFRRLTGQGPLSNAERATLFDEIGNWYYESGNGLLLSNQVRNIYLVIRENLRCSPKDLKPTSLAGQVIASPDGDAIRGTAAIRHFSLLRTAMRADLSIFTSPWGTDLTDEDIEFLTSCKVNTSAQPWRRSAPQSSPTDRQPGYE
jgi:hypothetical protein